MPILLTHLSPSLPVAVVVSGATLAGVGMCQFSTAPLFGRLADRFGCRPVLLASLSSSSLGLMITATSPWLWLVVISRLFTGSVQHAILLANVLMTELAQGLELPERLSRLSAASGIGFIVGALLSSLSTSFGLHMPIGVAAVLTAGNAALIFRFLSITRPKSGALQVVDMQLQALNSENLNHTPQNIQSITTFYNVWLADQKIIAFALIAIGYYITLSIWPIFTMVKFGWNSQQLAGTLFLYGILLFVSQGWLAKKLLKRYTSLQIARAAIISSSVTAVLYGLMPNGFLLIGSMILNLGGYLAEPMLRTVISSSYPLEQQGALMGRLGACTSIGLFLGPVLGASLLVPYSMHPASALLGLLPFGIAAALNLAAAFLLLRPRAI